MKYNKLYMNMILQPNVVQTKYTWSKDIYST